MHLLLHNVGSARFAPRAAGGQPSRCRLSLCLSLCLSLRLHFFHIHLSRAHTISAGASSRQEDYRFHNYSRRSSSDVGCQPAYSRHDAHGRGCAPARRLHRCHDDDSTDVIDARV